jgi:hypothetical protein
MPDVVAFPCRNGLDRIGGTLPNVAICCKATPGRPMPQRAFPLMLRDADFHRKL